MYDVFFYRNNKGNEPVKEYLQELASKNDKTSRIKLNKIRDYIQILKEHGTQAGEPYIKHLTGEIWEIRPLRDRILFAALVDGQFVLLHYFMKKSQKTPKREIERALKNLQDLKTRSQ